jgi:triphosphoribosyl-dephospho-CoA synthase
MIAMSGVPAPAIAADFLAACADELEAPKPGNVHRFAAGHRMIADDFRVSAAVAAPHIAASGARLGARILAAVEATQAAVGQNTNLGILLLCAPLAVAAEHGGDVQAVVGGVIAESDLDDAAAVYRAIAHADPGGLGAAPEHDVRDPVRVTLPVAMAAAADRDLIARQWSNGFRDVFAAAERFAAARRLERSWGVLAIYLDFLSRFPDSHVARKHGAKIAEAVRLEAEPWPKALARAGDPATLLPALLDWDASLKSRKINPGTSADLTVATIFAASLLARLRSQAVDG